MSYDRDRDHQWTRAVAAFLKATQNKKATSMQLLNAGKKLRRIVGA